MSAVGKLQLDAAANFLNRQRHWELYPSFFKVTWCISLNSWLTFTVFYGRGLLTNLVVWGTVH